MKILLDCFSIFENERGFNDFKPEYEYDAEYESIEDAIQYMDEICALSGRGERILFSVEILEDGPRVHAVPASEVEYFKETSSTFSR